MIVNDDTTKTFLVPITSILDESFVSTFISDIQVKGTQNVRPKRKGAVFLLKWFGIIMFALK